LLEKKKKIKKKKEKEKGKRRKRERKKNVKKGQRRDSVNFRVDEVRILFSSQLS